MPKVSVIIPTYNRRDLLPRAINSVLSQTYTDFELIIVDDGSTDGTRDLIEASYSDSRLRYIYQENNTGAAGARNTGIVASSGEYIAFQDSDDEWYPEKLEKQVQCMDGSNEEVGIVFCRYLYISESQGLKGICPAEKITQQDIDFPNLLYKNHIGAPTVLVKKKCLLEVGGFDTRLLCLEDYDLVLGITERYKALMVDEVLVTAYGYDNGVSSNVINYFNARIALFQRYKNQIFYYGLINDVKKELYHRAEECGLGNAVKEKIEAIIGERPVCEKKVSVVVPCYNSIKYLEDCFSSLESQTIGIENLEIILVNDASTDNTYELLLSFEKKYPDSVMVINLEENMRQGGARNIGISYASGEYLVFLDSDDTAPENAYERLYEIAKRYDTDIIQYNNNDTKTIEKEALYYIETDGERSILVSGGMLTFGCTNKFYRMGLVKTVASKFAEHIIFEEPPFVYPLCFYAEKIYHLPEVMYLCRQHEGSSMTGDAKQKNNILNHPQSQMIMLKDLLKRKWIFDKFYKEVSAYFIWSYYVETIIIAGQGGLSIDADYFKNMQKTVLAMFPDYMENDLIVYENSGYFPALNSLDKNYTQEELDSFCKETALHNDQVITNSPQKSKKKIAFLDWPCFMKNGTIEAFKKLGFEVYFFFHEDYQKFESDAFVSKFRDFLNAIDPDIWFSYNYYPILAKCCYEAEKTYVSVIYDSPYLMVYSDTLSLPTNRVYLFDRALASELNAKGLSNVFYTVLPGRVSDSMVTGEYDRNRTLCDVSFVGNLYDEKNSFYDDLIANSSEYLKGYLKGIVNVQSKLYDINLIDELLSEDIISEMKNAYPIESDGDIHEPLAYRYSDYILKRKATQIKRMEILEALGSFALDKGYKVNLYTKNDLVSIPGIRNLGITDYDTEMRHVFYDSKINLNISLKSIKSGIPLRCIDIMSSGGFLLSNYQEDLSIDFVPGEDFEFFSSNDEMLEKIEYYLTHEEERLAIALNGMKKIAEQYSFERVFSNILKEVG